MASTARMPTIATTIISSINVNPRLDARTIERMDFLSSFPFLNSLLPLAVDEDLVRPRGAVNMSVVWLGRIAVEVCGGGDDVPVGGRRDREHELRTVDRDGGGWRVAGEAGDGRVPEHDRPVDVDGQGRPRDPCAVSAGSPPRSDL